ncbi:MAG: aldo/keto reductase [Anaerolineae bacterium]|nr:aldo/keto reductase [Anaerolineae bacterium]
MSNHSAVTLGSGGPSIQPLGVGTWSWGDSFFWGYGRGTYTDVDIQAAFDVCLDAGVAFFDTAEVYGLGRSEKILGKLVRHSGKNLVVTTKFFPFPWRFTRGSVKRTLRYSLNRLGLASIDLYQVHWPFHPISIEMMMDGMADVVDAGLARAVGVSNYSPDQMRRAHAALLKRGLRLASNQVEYSLLNRGPERSGLLRACAELGITLIAYSPIGMGMLTGKYTPDNPPQGTRSARFSRAYLARIQPLIQTMRAIGEQHGGKTPSQVALNWLIGKGAVPIPGAKNARQAQENAGALGWAMTGDEMAELDRASEGL